MNSPLLKLFNESLNARAIVEGIKKQQQKKTPHWNLSIFIYGVFFLLIKI